MRERVCLVFDLNSVKRLYIDLTVMSETPDDASLQAIHLCCSTRRNLNNDLLSFSIEHLDVAWLAPTFSLVELDHDFHLSATALLFDQASKKLWGSVNKLGQQVA